MKLMLSCEEVSKLAAQQEVEKLSLTLRLSLRLHLAFCKACRQVQKQMALIKKAVKKYGDWKLRESSCGLSESAKERIKKSLAGKQNSQF